MNNDNQLSKLIFILAVSLSFSIGLWLGRADISAQPDRLTSNVHDEVFGRFGRVEPIVP